MMRIIFQEVGHDNIAGEFNKSSKKWTVQAPILGTYNRSLTKEFFIMSFISGLKEEIAKMVQLLAPTTLTQVVYMAILQEDILESNHWTPPTPHPPPKAL